MEIPKEYEDILKDIRSIRDTCRDLLDKVESYPCLERNTRRILSSLEMLGLDFPEISDFRQG